MKNSNLVLGIDVETTGLDPLNDQDVIIELGAVLWDWEAEKPISILSTTIELEEGRVLSPEIMRLTGITPDMVRAPYAKSEVEALFEFQRLASLADYYMAHNAKFDRAFLEAAYARNYVDPPERPWICSIMDVPYAADIQSRKLTYLAAEHGFLNPFAHRAVFDVLTMFQVVKNYPLESIVSNIEAPTLRLIGLHSKESNHLAKAAGFRWDPEAKEWYRIVKQTQIPHLEIGIPYHAVEVH